MTVRIEVTFYTRIDCHLCDEAAVDLGKLGEQFPIEVRSVDIDGDPAIRERYNDIVPAIDVAGGLISSAPLDWAAIRGAVALFAAGAVEAPSIESEPGAAFPY